MPKTTAKQVPKKGGGSKTSGGFKKNAKKSGKVVKAKRRKLAKKTINGFVFRHTRPSRKLGSGGVLPKTKALGRLIRWPKYVKLQRQKQVLLQRLKVPPPLNIFNNTVPKPLARSLVKLFLEYAPETRKEKRDRLRAQAKLQADGKPIESKKPILVKYGFNHVTNLIESGKPKLVLIANDVDPIELVLWMPTLCVKKGIPFAIIKNKARLGTLVNKKTASCVALCDVGPDKAEELAQLIAECKVRFNDMFSKMKKRWGARALGIKTRHKIEKRLRTRRLEQEKRKEALSAEQKGDAAAKK